MLAKLTENKKGVQTLCQLFNGKKNLEKFLGCKLSEAWDKYFSEITEFGYGWYYNFDNGTPKFLPQYIYNEFTKEVTCEESLTCIKGKYCYGIADNKEQIETHFREEIDDPDTQYVIFIGKIDYQSCKEDYEENGEGGYRPYKSGIYLGTYDQIRNCEYYGECDFPDDYQGYLLKFEICKVV